MLNRLFGVSLAFARWHRSTSFLSVLVTVYSMLFKHCGESVILSKSYVYFGFNKLGFNFVIYFDFNKFDFNFVHKAWTLLMRARSTGQRSIEAPGALVDALGALRCPNAVSSRGLQKGASGRGTCRTSYTMSNLFGVQPGSGNQRRLEGLRWS